MFAGEWLGHCHFAGISSSSRNGQNHYMVGDFGCTLDAVWMQLARRFFVAFGTRVEVVFVNCSLEHEMEKEWPYRWDDWLSRCGQRMAESSTARPVTERGEVQFLSPEYDVYNKMVSGINSFLFQYT